MAKTSKAKMRANAKYTKKTYFRANFLIKNSEFNAFENFRINNKYSTNGLVVSAVKEKIERMTGRKFEDLVKESQTNGVQSNTQEEDNINI